MGCVSSTPSAEFPMPASKTPIKAFTMTNYPKQQWNIPTKNPLEVNPSNYLPLMPQKSGIIATNDQIHRMPPGPRPTPTTTTMTIAELPEPWESSRDPIVISEEYLQEYVKLENSIHNMERQKVLQRLHVAVDQLQTVAMEIEKLEEVKQKMDTELKSRNLGKGPNAEATGRQLIDEIDAIDINNTTMIKLTGQPTSKMDSKDGTIQVKDSFEKKKEIVDEKLHEKRNTYGKLESEVGELNVQAAELLDMYLMQDELIVKIFGHAYSTDEEAKLVNSLQSLEDKKARIEHARRKWKEAQLLLEYACKQLAVAVQQWQGLPRVPSINLEVRYMMSDEVSQSLKSAGEKLNFVGGAGDGTDSDYCTPEELSSLETMTAHTRPEDTRHLTSALDDQSDTHKRAVAMLKWFNRVLNTAIHRDLVDVSEEVRVTSQALRRERIGFIAGRANEKYGRSVTFGDEFDLDGDDAMVKKMLSSCKDGRDYQFRSIPGVQRAPVAIINGGKLMLTKVGDTPKVPSIAEDLKEGSGHNVLNGLQSEHERNVAKLLLGERDNRAKVQKNVDQQLNARREKRDRSDRPLKR